VEPEPRTTEPDEETETQTVPAPAAEDRPPSGDQPPSGDPPAAEDQPPSGDQPAAEEQEQPPVEGQPPAKEPAAGQRWKAPVMLGLAAVVLVLSLLVGVVTWNLSRSHHPHSAQASGSRAAATPVFDADGCRWWAADPATRRYQRSVGIPPHSRARRIATRTMTISTALGPILVKVDERKTPCTVASFTFLAGRHFFDNTSCHRLVTEGIYILQCGDPSGTGLGGPAYVFADELSRTDPLPPAPDGDVVYPRGTVALANSGRDTNGSQFFIVYKDSPIPPDYTPFGTVMAGMGVVDDVAAAGDDGAYAPDPGGGHPKLPLTITSLTVG
jgi:peptidyl-prolyl cis-trans isomerase B (cyclophilin B)